MVHILCRVWFLVAPALVSISSTQCLAGPRIRIFDMVTGREINDGYQACNSQFGPPLDLVVEKGFVIYNSADGTGCNSSLISPPPTAYDELWNEQWILLVRRGQCSFVDKVRNAQLKQYDMVIVFNYITGDDIAPMYGINASDIIIPSIFVSYETGSTIREKYQYSHNVHVIIENSSRMFI